MRTARLLWLVVVLGTISACGGRSTPMTTDALPPDTAEPDAAEPDAAEPDAAEQATFTCEPQPATARGCGPLTAFGVTAGEPGKTYPVGCRVIFPFDLPFYPGSKASCTCTDWPDEDGPTWTCPV